MNAREFTEDEIVGLKFFKPVQELLGRLRHLHAHHNRELFYDDYIVLLLLYYFNPVLTSLRGIQQAADFDSVRKKLGVRRASLGSLSEAAHVFDPQPLRAIFLQLAQQAAVLPTSALPRPTGLPDNLRVLAVDGTLWSFLPRMARWFWADGATTSPPGFKALIQFDLLKGAPADATLASGYPSEIHALKKSLKPGCLFVGDRGYCDLELYQTIIDHQSSFLFRIGINVVAHTLETFPLSATARQAGVLSDERAHIGCQLRANKLRQPLRVVQARVFVPPSHNLKAPRRSQGEWMELRLLTDRFDIPAEEVVRLYHYRWHIELFFRWLKCTLGCKHFLSHCENGFALQFYAALIASLLLMLWTGRKPTKRLLEAVQLYFQGWIRLDELEARFAQRNSTHS